MSQQEQNEVPFIFADEVATVLSKRTQPKAKISNERDRFIAALKLLATKLKIQLRLPADTAEPNYLLLLQKIALQSGLQYREVNLTGDWWQFDNGSLLVFDKAGDAFVLLMEGNDYWLVNPVTSEKTKVDANVATTLQTIGFYLYRQLPGNALTLREILRFSFQPLKTDFKKIFFLQLSISFLSLITPIALGLFFSLAIPFADLSLLLQLFVMLLVNAFVVAGFTWGQIVSTFRIKLKANAQLQPAIWNRILHFPVSFFKRYRIGDLANRASGVDYIQQELSMSLLLSLIGGIMALISLVFLFFLSPLISLLILFLLIVMVIVVLMLTYREIIYLRKNYHLGGKLYALLLQVINSIGKLRIANAENRILSLWVKLFTRKTRMLFASGKIVAISQVFLTTFSTLILIIFFIAVVTRGTISVGTFIIYNAAFTQLVLSLTGIMAALSQVVRTIPLYERLSPIIKATTEDDKDKVLHPVLKGQIEFDQLTFGYPFSENLICERLSLSIQPGEFVGIIGPSGVGKSTLLRLLVALEIPQSGKIFYDGNDLQALNLRSFRNQLGVLLQNSVLMPGTLLENIIGIHSQLTLDDAWQAAQLARIAEEIQAMPMGMQTMVTEGGQSLSLGQRQRVLLARALVKKPKILLLDEAMSGIDDATQSQIQECLSSLKITRIIVTQHPQLLADADKVILLNNFKSVETGSFQEIINTPNFKNLIANN